MEEEKEKKKKSSVLSLVKVWDFLLLFCVCWCCDFVLDPQWRSLV